MRSALLVIVTLLVVTSCKTKMKTVDNRNMRIEEQNLQVFTEKKSNILFFNDTLSGTIPLKSMPVSGEKPMVIPISSTGMSLELQIDDRGISYKAVARPVARSQLSEVSRTAQKEATITLQEQHEQKQVKRLFPSWILIAVILAVLILWLLVKVFKTNFKLF